MAISDKKVTSFGGKDVASAPNIMLGTAAENKAVFDNLLKLVLLPQYNALIDQLVASNASNFLGATISSSTAVTLDGVLSYIATSLADRYTKAVSDSNLTTAVNPLVKSVVLDTATGVLTVTKRDGTVTTTDTNLEKIPASMTLVEVGGATYLRITNDDGSYTETNVSTLLNTYNFNASSTVVPTVINNADGTITVTMIVKDASITLDKLDPTAVATLSGYVTSAQDSATQAAASAVSASSSASSASGYATTAIQKANEATGSAASSASAAISASSSANTATQKATDALGSATLSESYAKGGTGIRAGEATDNAKYYMEQARDIVGGDFVTGATIGDVPVTKSNNVLHLPQYPVIPESLPPTAHTHTPGDVSTDANNRFVSDSQIASWDSKASKSSVVDTTLTASSWSGSSTPYTYSLTVSGVTTTSNQEILPSTSITQAQLEALQGANIVDGGQSANTVILKAYGDKPSVDIPIRVIKRGDA